MAFCNLLITTIIFSKERKLILITFNQVYF